MIDLAALKAALEAATKGELVSIPAGNRPEIWTDDGKVLVCRVESLRFVDDAAYIVATQPRVMREIIAEMERLRAALLDATAHLAGAASAYRTYARRSAHLGRGPADPLFTTRASDFDRAVERARAALAGDRHD